MRLKKFYAILMSAVFSLSMATASYADETLILVTPQDEANASGFVGTCSCVQCKEIEEFFAGEQDAAKRDLSVSVWKAAIHPEMFVNASGALYVGTYDNAEGLKYTALTLGLDNGWPRMRQQGNQLKVYYKIGNADAIKSHKETVDRLYGIMQEIKAQSASEDITGKLRVAHDRITGMFNYSDEYINWHPYSKMSDCLRESKACCVGYSTMFKIASNMLGAQTSYVGSDAHMFVGVTLNGVERYVDVTSDDTFGGYEYFLFDNTGLGYPWVIDRR